MKRASLETSVGVFVMVGLACVAYLTIKLGKMEWLGGDYYYVTAKFHSVTGLKVGATVDIGGVEIGKVESIALEPSELVAVVRMKIRQGVPLSDDAIASVRTSGLIGDKFVKIEPGGSETLLKDGERIAETQSAVDIEDLIGKYAFGGVDTGKQSE